MGKSKALLFHGMEDSLPVPRVPLLCVEAGGGVKTNSLSVAVRF